MLKYIRRGLNWHANLWPKVHPKPPFKHIVQIGDPILRTKCEEVPVASITLEETKNIISAMKRAMMEYYCVGLSAPQVGINKRIFLMGMTAKQVVGYDFHLIQKQEIYSFPLMVFINPSLKVLDVNKVCHPEACESVKGYCAEVSRYREVQINGYNEDGAEVTINFGGWPARIAQHEMDHLDGKIYTDIMNKETFACPFWKDINLNEGKIRLPYSPT